MDQERIVELRSHEKHLRASGQMVGVCLGECLDALEAAQAELAALRGLSEIELRQHAYYRARVAELGAEVNLLHRQRHAAQEDAANARLLAAVCHPAPDVRGELEILREGFGLMRTAYNTHALRDYQTALAEQIIAKYDALRSGEAGKGKP